MLELKRIYYQPATSEEPVLQGISLRAHPGIPSIITGSSGSGKTSLIEIISGISMPQQGTITLQGKEIKPRERRSLSGVVFQFPERHFIGLTILQELRLGHRRLSSDRIYEILHKVGLSNINLKQSPENLSGGQQRRLAIAVQLTRKPRILLLDEPTAGLDWSVKDEIIELIKQISTDIILIIVTHEHDAFKKIDSAFYQLQEMGLKQLIIPNGLQSNP